MCQSMVQTLGDMGYVREIEGEVLVVDMYKDVHRLVSTCETWQMHLVVLHCNKLHPTYPSTIHFKWMVDLVTMLMGVEQMRYLVLA